jgi:hypothetical protein
MARMPDKPGWLRLLNPAQWKNALAVLARPGRAGKAWRAAMAVAAASDLVSLWAGFLPPVQVAVDLGTVALLVLCLRWRWAYLIALIPEAFPGTAVLPFWVLVVAGLAALNSEVVVDAKK